MNSLAIINGLHPYLQLLHDLEAKELIRYSNNDERESLFFKSVSLRYSTITIKLNHGVTGQQFLIGNLEIKDQTVSINNLYCEDEVVKGYVLQHAPKKFPAKQGTFIFDPDIQQYLSIADEIAKEGYLRSTGDDYRPGYYSESIVETDKIILKQVNHWNSRSIDHKNDYHLRDLSFIIPLNDEVILPSRFNEQKIGNMRIDFSDRSSVNNKSVGEAIQNKIEAEKLKFEEKK
jgi:hypothetical protein